LDGVDTRHIAEGVNGSLLFSTDRGLYRQSGEEGKFIDQSAGLPSNNVYCSLLDREGTVWVATDHGVRRLQNGNFVGFPKGEALANESVRSIFQDADGFLWFGTADGKLKKFLTFNGTALVETYNSDRFGIPAAVSNFITQDSNGNIWLATEAGAVRHLPDRNPPTTRVRVFVNGRETDETHLGSGRYNVAFNFQGISPSGEVQYAYRLEGYDKDWHLLGPTEERRVSYNDLPSGNFTFQVRSFNHDLYSVDAYKIPIEVAVPFYLKGWFFGLSGLAVIGMGLGIVAIKRQQERGPALPPHLQQFVRIESNPYIVGNPVRNANMFFGREDDFRYVQTKMEGAPQGVVIVFCGERRTGKSSILYQLLNGRLGARFVPVFIDMQEMVVDSDRGFFGRVARLIAQTLGSAGQDTLEQYSFASVDQNPYELFTEFIEDCLRILKHKTLLLLVDEYELLETKVSDGKLNEEIFTYFAALMEKHEHLGFIFTGSRRLEERDKRYWGKMLSRAIYRKVSYLSEDDTRRLITEPVKDKIIYHRNVIDAIVRLTSGQPFYTQVICQNLVDYLNEHEKNLLLSSDLKQIVDEIFDHPLPQMIYFWDSLNDDEKVTLSLLAECLGDSISYASTKDLLRVIRKNNYPVNLSEDTIHLTLEELFRTEVLLKSFDDSYRFRVGLFRAWIRRSHSIWQVVKEVKTL
jgi:AAA+ ATPase superfamily predicted ATPase